MLSSPTVKVMDRRRARRYRLQPDAALSFFAGEEDQSSLGIGKLLNLSLDGLACKVSGSTCHMLNSCHVFFVRLSIGEPTCKLHLAGQLVNTVEGADEDEYIVGIEFRGAADEIMRTQINEVLSRGKSSNL